MIEMKDRLLVFPITTQPMFLPKALPRRRNKLVGQGTTIPPLQDSVPYQIVN